MRIIISETLFADFEARIEVQERFLTRLLQQMRSVADCSVPDGHLFRAVYYVSNDKSSSRNAIEAFLEDLPDHVRSRFVIVGYDHPEGGYNLPATHPDLITNPNKHSPRRDQLFLKALEAAEIVIGPSDTVIRIAIDDDDRWMPTQLEQVATFGRRYEDPGSVVGVGFRNAFVAYVGDGGVNVDKVEMSRLMSGNKFYIFPPSQHSRIDGAHPWGLAEIFTGDYAERFARAGIKLVETSENDPGWVYVRWGDNLTVTGKQVYYKQRLGTFCAANASEIISTLLSFSRD